MFDRKPGEGAVEVRVERPRALRPLAYFVSDNESVGDATYALRQDDAYELLIYVVALEGLLGGRPAQ